MKKTGLHVALALAVPLGAIAVFTHRFLTCALIAVLLGLAAAFYDMRATRG